MLMADTWRQKQSARAACARRLSERRAHPSPPRIVIGALRALAVVDAAVHEAAGHPRRQQAAQVAVQIERRHERSEEEERACHIPEQRQESVGGGPRCRHAPKSAATGEHSPARMRVRAECLALTRHVRPALRHRALCRPTAAGPWTPVAVRAQTQRCFACYNLQ